VVGEVAAPGVVADRCNVDGARAHARTGKKAGVQNHPGAAVGHRLNDNRGEMRQQHVKITFA
jgi:hypothetical protein